jgi:hypothetical protein
VCRTVLGPNSEIACARASGPRALSVDNSVSVTFGSASPVFINTSTRASWAVAIPKEARRKSRDGKAVAVAVADTLAPIMV